MTTKQTVFATHRKVKLNLSDVRDLLITSDCALSKMNLALAASHARGHKTKITYADCERLRRAIAKVGDGVLRDNQ